MGRPFYEYFNGRCWCCNVCKRHLAKCDELVSTAFHSKNGQAYLFNNAVNVTFGPREERLMTTGLHIVVDIYCASCRIDVGWRYEQAYDEAQKYKEGKYILERCKISEDPDSDDSDSPDGTSDCEEL